MPQLDEINARVLKFPLQYCPSPCLQSSPTPSPLLLPLLSTSSPHPSISFFLFISVLQIQPTQQRLTQHLDPRRGEGHRRRALSLQRGQGRGRKWASRRRTQQQQNSITTVRPLSTTSSLLFRAAGSGSGS